LSAVIKSSLLRSLNSDGEYMVESGDVIREREARLRAQQSPAVRAKSIVEQAQDDAAQMMEAARQEAEAIRSAAYQQGMEEAQAEFAADRAALTQTVADTIADVNQQVEDFWGAIEPELLKLAVDVARKVVHREIVENQEVVLNMVKIALYQLRDRQSLKIRVSTADYDLLREHKEEIMGSCDGMRNLEILQDRRVEQGGCLIESDNGNLDARIETQIREVERALLEAAHDGRHEVAADTE
jgi:flagellar assembly protein FliH